MTLDREAQFRKLVEQFPASPMGHFSLGKLLLEQGRYQEAAASLEEATRLDPAYAAALVALGEAQAAAGLPEQARITWTRARARALEQNHPSLAEEVDSLLADL
ncbi:MAG TPA: tetratricopeptide repeat protein [Myxococcaceae bacterium]|jgi:tetratricopeptide (TPR) repeat protein|nr:tetratricopeptide repeat protein [Myxococcaceae bacterium]